MQRAVLVALAGNFERGVDFITTYLDFSTFREEIRKYSPEGHSPVLRVDGKAVSTQTEAICEYIDQSAGRKLLPGDAPTLLRVRGREAAVRTLLDTLRDVFTATNRSELDSALDQLFGQLTAVDLNLRSDGTDENTFRMDMAALAPAFSLMEAHPGLIDNSRWQAIPRLHRIARNEAARDLIQRSRCPNYAAEFQIFFEVTRSSFPQLITEQP